MFMIVDLCTNTIYSRYWECNSQGFGPGWSSDACTEQDAAKPGQTQTRCKCD